MFTRKIYLSWKVGVLVVALLLALPPAAALAQGFAQAVLYEVLENPPPRPSTGGNVGAFVPGPGGTLTRLAQATLTGNVAANASGSLLSWADGEIDAYAQSRVDFLSGLGPINGSFTVDTVVGTGSISGKIAGTLDLSTVLAQTVPLAPTEGSWETLGKPSSRLGGIFEGVAQVPFPCGVTFCYLDPVTFAQVPLAANEFKNGVPLVRFLISFTAD